MNLEDEGIIRYEMDGIVTYKCIRCVALLNSMPIVDQHLKGNRHKRSLAKKQWATSASTKYEGKRRNLDDLEVVPTKKTRRANADVNKPTVGLDYVYEHQDPTKKSESKFRCIICEKVLNKDTIIAHIKSYAHMRSYLKRVDPAKFLSSVESLKSSRDSNKKVKEVVLKLAEEALKEYGSGRVQITDAPLDVVCVKEENNWIDEDDSNDNSEEEEELSFDELLADMRSQIERKKKAEISRPRFNFATWVEPHISDFPNLSSLCLSRIESDEECRMANDLISSLIRGHIHYKLKKIPSKALQKIFLMTPNAGNSSSTSELDQPGTSGGMFSM